MKLLVDMNLSPRWVGLLAGADIAAVHWRDAGGHNASDSEIMDYARAHEYIVLTHDLDFGAILAATHKAQRCANPSRGREPGSGRQSRHNRPEADGIGTRTRRADHH